MKTVVKNAIKNAVNVSTPDGAVLNRLDGHYVFAYGTLRWGFARYENLKARYQDLLLLGAGRTSLSAGGFMMYNTRTGSQVYPMVLRNAIPDDPVGKNAVAKPIFGDLLYVPTQMMYSLDRIEGNTVFYQRELLPVEVMTKTAEKIWKLQKVMAWVYVGIPHELQGVTMRRVFGNNREVKYSTEMQSDFYAAKNQGPAFKVSPASVYQKE